MKLSVQIFAHTSVYYFLLNLHFKLGPESRIKEQEKFSPHPWCDVMEEIASVCFVL